MVREGSPSNSFTPLNINVTERKVLENRNKYRIHDCAQGMLRMRPRFLSFLNIVVFSVR